MAKHDRSVGSESFMSVKWHRQHCPSCKKTYEFLALGVDRRRSTLKCQLCDSPEAGTESELPVKG